MKRKNIIIFAALAVIIFFLGAQAATANPVSIRIGDTEIIFLPLILRSKAADAPSGVLYVFPSTTTTDGDAGGRSLMGDICPTEDPNAHFCSVHEIENAWSTTGVYFHSSFQQSWVDYPTNLGTKVIKSDYNNADSSWASDSPNYKRGNCWGWTNNADDKYGVAIRDYAVTLESLSCDEALPLACCKQVP